jgi:hypothetical protein
MLRARLNSTKPAYFLEDSNGGCFCAYALSAYAARGIRDRAKKSSPRRGDAKRASEKHRLPHSLLDEFQVDFFRYQPLFAGPT